MELPIFFHDGSVSVDGLVNLDPDASKHIVQVLRLRSGDSLKLTDGKGNFWITTISSNDKKNCIVRINDHIPIPPSAISVTIAISLLKNMGRFEWFVEKATEIGVTKIVPLVCQRTERQHFRAERLKNIMVSAMLQSAQAWLPELLEPIEFSSLINSWNNIGELRLIAHCADSSKSQLIEEIKKRHTNLNRCILIGPEGDFTKDEIESALKINCIPVALGNTRLRTETAGIVAATFLAQE